MLMRGNGCRSGNNRWFYSEGFHADFRLMLLAIVMIVAGLLSMLPLVEETLPR